MNKKIFKDYETVIDAGFLNDLQDEVISTSDKADGAVASIAPIQKDVTDIKDGIDAITSSSEMMVTLTDADYTTKTGQYFKVSGNSMTFGSSQYWDYYLIDVVPGDDFTISTTANNEIVAWAELSASGTVIRSAERTASQSSVTNRITISEGTVTLAVNHRASTSYPTTIQKLVKAFHISDDEAKLIVEKSGMATTKQIDMTEKYRDNASVSTAQSGIITASGYYIVRCSMIPKQVLHISTPASKTGVGFAFYSGYNRYLNGVTYDGSGEYTVEAPDGTAYALITVINGTKISAEVTSSQKAIAEYLVQKNSEIPENPLENIDKMPTFIRMFRKIVCIGDSLTRGQFDTTYPDSSGADVGTAFSYPMQMAKMTGCEVVNLGIGGATASRQHSYNWMEVMERSGVFPADDFLTDPGDCYIIALGTNDLSASETGGAFTGDVSTDIHLLDWRLNATTSVGGYAAIIQRILKMQPKAKIFCVTIPRTRNIGKDKASANTKIKAIAARFGCYVIDLFTYAEKQNDDFKNVYKNSGHNNALGYNVRARQYIAYIDYIINSVPEDFRNVAFIGTDYDYDA